MWLSAMFTCPIWMGLSYLNLLVLKWIFPLLVSNWIYFYVIGTFSSRLTNLFFNKYVVMSADGRTSAVMRGIKHGACDYLIKPVRMEELKNVWQHVVRKKWNESKDVENSGSFEDSDRQGRVADESEYASSMNEGTDASWKTQKKKKRF